MNDVDNRIVEMEFDNDQFESGVNTSIKSLDNLKKSLDFSGMETGLSAVASAASSFNLSAISNSVDDISSKFNLWSVAAASAIQNVVNKATNAATSLAKSLSVDQITSGWSKYAEKTTAVQTIMSNITGDWDSEAEKMEYVTSELERLNWFTDETSYNFTDMTSNIGKFTSQAIDLDDAVVAMEGISTWAALSGQNATKAGQAMYNISQAMGVGSLQLVDYKSIENANMATATFKQAVMDAAVAEGTLTKSVDENGEAVYKTTSDEIVNMQNFRDRLTKDKWITNDVLMDVLKQFGGFADELGKFIQESGEDISATDFMDKMSDWEDGAISIEDCAADLGISVEDLQAEFEKLSGAEYDLGRKSFKAAQETKTFAEMIDATKDAVSTNWSNTFENIFGNYLEAKELWTEITERFYDIFVMPGKKRNVILSTWKSLEDGGRQDLLDSFFGLWDRVDDVIEHIKDGWESVFATKTNEEAAQSIANVVNKFQDFVGILDAINPASEKYNENLGKSFSSIAEFGGRIVKIFATSAETAWDLVSPIISPISTFLYDSFVSIGDITEALNPLLESFDGNLAKNVKTFFSELNTFGQGDNARTITGAFNQLYEAIIKVTKSAGPTFQSSISDGSDILSASIEVIHSSLGYIIDGFTGFISDLTGIDVSKVGEKIHGLSDDVEKALLDFDDKITATISTVLSDVWDSYNDSGNLLDAIVNSANTTVVDVLDAIAESVEGSTGLDIKPFLNIFEVFSTGIASALTNIQSTGFNGLLNNVRGTIVNTLAAISMFINSATGLDTSSFVSIFTGAVNDIYNTLNNSMNGGGVLGLLDGFATGLENFLNRVSNFIYDATGWDLSGIFGTLSGVVSDAHTAIVDFLTKGWDFHPLETLKDKMSSLSGIFAPIGAVVTKASDLIGSFYNAITGKTTSTDEGSFNLFEWIGKAISKAAELINTGAGKLAEGFGTIKDNIDLKDYSGLDTLLNGGVIYTIGFLLARLIKGIYDLGKDTSNISKIFESVQGCLESFQTRIQSETILKIAEGVGILAVAMLLLASVDSDALGQTAGVVALLVAELAGAVLLISHFKKTGSKSSGLIGKLFGVSGADLKSEVLEISVAMLMLAAAMKIMSTIPYDSLGVTFLAVSGMMLVLVGITKMMASIKGTAKGGATILALATSLILIAGAIKLIGNSINENGWSGLEALGSAIAILAVIAYALGNIKGGTKGGATILALATSLILIAAAIRIVGKSVNEDSADGLWSLALLIGELAGIAYILGSLPGSTKGGATVLALAVSLILVASAIKKVSQAVNQDSLVGVEALAGIIAELAIIAYALGGLKNGTKGGATVLALAVSLVLIASAVKKVADITDPASLIGIIALAAIIAELAVVAGLLGHFGAAGGASMLAMSVSLLAMAVALKVVADIPWEQLAFGATVLIVMAGAMAFLMGMMFATSTGAGAMLIGAAAILVLAFAVKTLQNVDFVSVVSGLAGLAIAIVVLIAGAAAMAVLAPALLTSAGGIAAFGASLLVLAAGALVLSVALQVAGKAITNFISSIAELVGFDPSSVTDSMSNWGQDMVDAAAVADGTAFTDTTQTTIDNAAAAVDTGNAAQTISDGMAEDMTTNEDVISDAETEMIENGTETGAENADTTGAGEAVAQNMSTSIQNGEPTVEAAVQTTVQDGADAGLDAVDTTQGTTDMIADIEAELKEAGYSEIPDTWTEIFDGSIDASSLGLDGDASDIISTLGAGLTGNSDALSGDWTSTLTSVFSTDSGSFDFGSVGTNITSLIGGGISSSTNIQDSLGEAVSIDTSSFGGSLQATGVDMVTQMAFGINNASAVLSNALTARAIEASNIPVSSEYQAAGENLMSNIATGISNSTTDIGSTMMDEIAAGVSASTSVTDAVNTSLETAAGAITTGSYSSAGGAVASAIGSGITGKRGSVTAGARSVSVSGAYQVRATYSSWYSAGGYVAQGLANGIYAGRSSVVNAAASVASAAIAAANSKAGVASPSKLTYKTGMFVDEGFANGITDFFYLVTNAAGLLGSQSVYTINQCMNDLATDIDTNTQFSPAIRPVMDTSGLTYGFGQIENRMNRAMEMTNAIADSGPENSFTNQALDLGREILGTLQNGGDVYINGKVLVGYVNRGLGAKV